MVRTKFKCKLWQLRIVRPVRDLEVVLIEENKKSQVRSAEQIIEGYSGNNAEIRIKENKAWII